MQPEALHWGYTADDTEPVTIHQFLRIVTPLTAIVLLAACAPEGPRERLQDYRARLARTLDIEAVSPTEVVTALPPRTGELQVPINAASIDTLDFLALSGCEVQINIGRRNSSLGLTAAPSQRLLLELEFLRLAPACIQHMNTKGKTELAHTLQSAWESRRAQLPALIFNATLGSAEYRQFWRATSLPPEYPEGTSSAVVTALQDINALARRWLGGDYRAQNRAFEILLSEVAKGDGGELYRALALQFAGLAAADRMLEERRARGPLCRPKIRPAAVDILETVVRRFFVGRIQVWSAGLGRRYHQLLPAIHELEDILEEALPPSFIAWRQQRDAELQIYTQAPRHHVATIKRLLKPCDESFAR